MNFPTLVFSLYIQLCRWKRINATKHMNLWKKQLHQPPPLFVTVILVSNPFWEIVSLRQKQSYNHLQSSNTNPYTCLDNRSRECLVNRTTNVTGNNVYLYNKVHLSYTGSTVKRCRYYFQRANSKSVERKRAALSHRC